MPAWKIRTDVRRAFSLRPDTIVFNECNSVTRNEMRRQAHRLGYGLYIPCGAASQVCIAWRADKFARTYQRKYFAMPGRAKVSPHRYVVRVQLRCKATGERIDVYGTHMVSSGWTGRKWLDAWRRRGWYRHLRVMRRQFAKSVHVSDVVIWSGDCNRPPHTWHGKAWHGLLAQFRRLRTDYVVRTDATHGRTIFDYVGVLAKRIKVRTKAWQTPDFYSDHDGILTDFSW